MVEGAAILEALAVKLGDVLGAMTGITIRVLPTAGDTVADWQVPIRVGGTRSGTATLALSREGAVRIVTAIVGHAADVADTDIVDTLRELLGQAAAAYAYGTDNGPTLDVETPAMSGTPAPPQAVSFDMMLGTDEPVRLTFWADLAPVAARAVEPARPAAPPLSVDHVRVPVDAAVVPRNLDVVLDIELPITVRFGETQMTLENLARLGPGSMIDLARSPDDPVDLLVNGRLVARGQVVVVSGCYGLRVSEVVSTADRLRSLEL
ncbi:MAG: FliM/FliN family flagellar motor switch protein [Acidobacteria bacterium]|nr:FliM/FliN family flagellar motor switch protein [Acidobacteriota bacterium]